MRVIPAPAGHPQQASSALPVAWGHPRTCGASVARSSGLPLHIGSSPHLRGIRLVPWALRDFARVIPAPAGHPRSGVCRHGGCPGHPRTCGASSNSRRASLMMRGSSPHLRGIPNMNSKKSMRGRVIPAPAGHPLLPWRRRSAPQGHPRTCGASGGVAAMLDYLDGSSPHLRGIPVFIIITAPHFWVIPAPAGHPLYHWVVGGDARVIPAPAGHPGTLSRIFHYYRKKPGHPRTCGASPNGVIHSIADSDS